MKIVFFGTPQIAADILKYLLSAEQNIAAVVTQPDRAKKRSASLVFSPVKEAALEAGIEKIFQPEKASDEGFMDALESTGADIFIVAAYGQKLPARILDMAPYGCINVHPSLLPKYRGAAPAAGAILNGDSVSGVSIMKMAEKMDTGDILLQEEIAISPCETTASLEKKSSDAAGPMLIKVISGLKEGTMTGTAQDDSKSSYIRQFSKESGLIDFNSSAEYIERMSRAYDPWPSAYTYLDGKTFKIWRARLCEKDFEGRPGEVVSADKKIITVKCGTGALDLLEVQLEGKKRMSCEEFLRGRKIAPGTLLGL